MNRLTQLLVLSFVLISTSVFSQSSATPAVKIFADSKKSSVTYSMSHPMHEWDGTSKEVKAIILYNRDKQSIENIGVSIKVASFDSQNANRDSHMIETLEGIKYPNVTFASKSIKQDGNKLNILGTLTFHGVSKPISIEVQKTLTGKIMVIEGGFQVLMTEYKVEKPSMMGMSTSDIIKIKLHIEFEI